LRRRTLTNDPENNIAREIVASNHIVSKPAISPGIMGSTFVSRKVKQTKNPADKVAI
jgi:hypothetical protein